MFEGPATKQYCEAFAKLENGDAGAMPAFAALVGEHADDALAAILRQPDVMRQINTSGNISLFQKPKSPV